MDLPASGAYGDVGARTRWDDLVAVHFKMTGTIHGVAQFLQWHRYYVHVHVCRDNVMLWPTG